MAISPKLLELTIACPNLLSSNFEVTSDPTRTYNCIAWAIGDNTKWWEPEQYFWPDGVAREFTITAYLEAFRTEGFVECDNANLEDGYEKIAIYTRDGVPMHAARQLKDGWWTSKIGRHEDIKHQLLSALEGSRFGMVTHFMKRVPVTESDLPL